MYITCRKATINDLEQIVEIALETRSDQWMDLNMPPEVINKIYSEYFDVEVPLDRTIFVAVSDGTIVGFLAAVLGKTRAHLSCAVRPKRANRGIGKALVQIAVSSLDNIEIEEFNAVCKSDNIAACRTLATSGFELRGPWVKHPENFVEYFLSKGFR